MRWGGEGKRGEGRRGDVCRARHMFPLLFFSSLHDFTYHPLPLLTPFSVRQRYFSLSLSRFLFLYRLWLLLLFLLSNFYTASSTPLSFFFYRRARTSTGISRESLCVYICTCLDACYWCFFPSSFFFFWPVEEEVYYRRGEAFSTFFFRTFRVYKLAKQTEKNEYVSSLMSLYKQATRGGEWLLRMMVKQRTVFLNFFRSFSTLAHRGSALPL